MATTNNVVQMATAAVLNAAALGGTKRLLRVHKRWASGRDGGNSTLKPVGAMKVVGPGPLKLVLWAVAAELGLLAAAYVLMDVGLNTRLLLMVAIAGLPFVGLVLMAINEGTRYRQIVGYRDMLRTVSTEQLEVSRFHSLMCVASHIEIENELRRRVRERV